MAWVDGKPDLLVSFCLTHIYPLIVDERREETADRVVRYQTD